MGIFSLLTPDVLSRALVEGVDLYEPFGGLCAGLEMLLRAGIRVNRYYYSDTSTVSRKVAWQRVHDLAQAFPGQLDRSALSHTFRIPQDVWHVDYAAMFRAGFGRGTGLFLVVAGFECQNLSPAGDATGLAGERSATFFPLLDILRQLKKLRGSRPTSFLVENTAFQQQSKHKPEMQADFDLICSALGNPVTLDAARLGSRAHRLRNFWTNLAPTKLMQQVFNGATRPPGLFVNDILDAGRYAQVIERADSLPFYVANRVVGEAMCVLPTLVSFRQSNAYRLDEFGAPRPGLLWDEKRQELVEPNVAERERAMGYESGVTYAPSLSAQQRFAMIGRAMDYNMLQMIWAVSSQLASRMQLPEHQPGSFSQASQPGCGEEPVDAGFLVHSCSCSTALTVLTASDSGVAGPDDANALNSTEVPSRDVWEDELVMEYLRTGAHREGSSAAERKRIWKRQHDFKWQSGVLRRRDTLAVVPPPDARLQLVRDAHAQGHFGRDRTVSLLRSEYWWSGMAAQVAEFVRGCIVCDLARARPLPQPPELQPLPIKGPFYRWGVDLTGPLPKTTSGYEYIMICVEYWSKHIELVPLTGKDSDSTARVLLERVLSQFGAPAEIVTDNGTEFEGAFQTLCEKWYIDHRRTSPYHPQADGLAERVVQTLKKSLRRMRMANPGQEWDELLPYIALGYRCSEQKATGFSPFELLYARSPILPSAARETFSEALDFDDPSKLTADLEQRALILQRHSVIAGENLQIAQHRDALWYARTRSGAYRPSVSLDDFAVGDYVYLMRRQEHTLELPYDTVILRIKALRASGILQLEGVDGDTVQVHRDRCAKCMLPIAPPHTIADVSQTPCEHCSLIEDSAVNPMLLCDACDKGWHLRCLRLSVVPDGEWLCPACGSYEVAAPTSDAVSSPSTVVATPARTPTQKSSFVPPPLRVTDRESVDRRALFWDNRRIRYLFDDAELMGQGQVGDQQSVFLGKVKYLGYGRFPRCYEVYTYRDRTSMQLTEDELRKLYLTVAQDQPSHRYALRRR